MMQTKLFIVFHVIDSGADINNDGAYDAGAHVSESTTKTAGGRGEETSRGTTAAATTATAATAAGGREETA